MKNDNRALLITLVVLVALALIGPMIGGTLFGPGGMWEDTDRAAGWGLWLLAGFLPLSLLAAPAALVVGIVFLVSLVGGGTSAPLGRGGQGGGGRGERDPALDTARRRYAAGEISHEEYEDMRKRLER